MFSEASVLNFRHELQSSDTDRFWQVAMIKTKAPPRIPVRLNPKLTLAE
jgi:hypothetical protein